MIHRLALAIGAVAATGILAFAAGTAAVAPQSPAMELTAEQVKAPTLADGGLSSPAASEQAVVQQTVTDTVYVEPIPEPEVVVVDRPRRGARNQSAAQSSTGQSSADPTGTQSDFDDDAWDDDDWDDEDDDEDDDDDDDEDDEDEDEEDEDDEDEPGED